MDKLTESLQVYLVGGAVRDQLLGLTIVDQDWVVVGSTPEHMLNLGFKPVGKDFPVFLHPTSKQEYALARTERKTGPGYTGFEFHTSPDVTLEQDLSRRDLTVNAMAIDSNGKLIDYFKGEQDLDNHVLRHVTAAFSEDPVRVLRVARFAARFNFDIADETNELMIQMVADGEVDHLVAERVWQEVQHALQTDTPSRFVQTLRACNALERIFPQLDALYGVPQPERYHPEIDTGIHTEMVVDQAARLSNDSEVRFAALLHDLGKALTPTQHWPHHHGHEQLGLKPIQQLCDRYRVPRSHCELALLVSEFHLHCHRMQELRAETILKLLTRLDGFRRPMRVHQFVLACEADARGRSGLEESDYPQAELLLSCHRAALSVKTQPIIEQGLAGEEIGRQLASERVTAISGVQSHW